MYVVNFNSRLISIKSALFTFFILVHAIFFFKDLMCTWYDLIGWGRAKGRVMWGKDYG